MLEVRILDVPKLSRNANGYLTSQKALEHKSNETVNCFITFMFQGLLFTTEDMKKDEVQVPRRNEMLSLYCTALGTVSNNEEHNPE